MSVRAVAARAVARLPLALHRHVPSDLRSYVRVRLGRTAAGDIDHEPVPPPPRSGEEIGPPDFVVAGAADAGSRWWTTLMAGHPDVAPLRPAHEVSRYFSRFACAPFGAADIVRFHRWFPRRPGQLAGHWSPDALAYPWVAPLLAQAAPDTRLVVLVRDPIERLASGLAHTADGRAPHVGSHLVDAAGRGFYAEQLRHLGASFPTAQVLVLQYERCVSNPVGQLSRADRFLGLDSARRSGTVSVPPPRSPVRSGRLAGEARERLVAMYRADVAELVSTVPGLDISLWPNFSSDPGSG